MTIDGTVQHGGCAFCGAETFVTHEAGCPNADEQEAPLVVALRRERDDARACARRLATAARYRFAAPHDAVATAFSYPIDPSKPTQ